MKLVFWPGELSLHQSAMIRGLCDLGHDVTVVAAQRLHEGRKRMGWAVPDLGTTNVLTSPTPEAVSRIVASSGDAVHIAFATRGRFSTNVIDRCVDGGARWGIHSEAPHPEGAKVVAKHLVYTFNRLRHGGKAGFFLALGTTGMRWFASCGYREDKLVPFAYATERLQVPIGGTGDDFNIVFVGQCIPIKRLDLALDALANLRLKEWTFTVVGDGPRREAWEEWAGKIGLQDRVRFLGALPNPEAVGVIGRSDLLVLPSDHEGWGAVVNEALMCGVPAIASDACGAADLLREDWRGGVFRSGDASSLRSEIERFMDAGKPDARGRERIRRWSECIDGRSLAQYLVRVLDYTYNGGKRPSPPWTGELRL